MIAAAFDAECRACPRLAAFLQAVKQQHPGYFARPVPPFGDPEAHLLVVGLAPGMHGANATGRPFTGDHAGILLYRTLYDFGFASAPISTEPDDGLILHDCRITNAVKCTGLRRWACRRAGWCETQPAPLQAPGWSAAARGRGLGPQAAIHSQGQAGQAARWQQCGVASGSCSTTQVGCELQTDLSVGYSADGDAPSPATPWVDVQPTALECNRLYFAPGEYLLAMP